MNLELRIFTDGGALGNPGPAASAFVVKNGEQVIHQAGFPLGSTTNNVAEYQAVIFALKWLIETRHWVDSPTINFFLDSQLVVNQLNGLYKIKDAKLKLLVIEIKSLEQEINSSIYYQHVPREQNTLADALVKKTLNN